jgi:hypothetical protein
MSKCGGKEGINGGTKRNGGEGRGEEEKGGEMKNSGGKIKDK